MKMHRFPKLFSHRSEPRKSGADSSSSRRPAKPKRLERSNALRNVNYEFSLSSSASFSSHSPEESQRASSLDLYSGKTTSFRVDGTEGEFQVICEAFGFSGIDDFAISPEEYEAMKVGSSTPGMVSKTLEPLYQETEVDCDDVVKFSYGNGYIGAIDVIDRKIEGLSVGNLDNSYGLASKKLGETCDFGYSNRARGVSELSTRLEDGVSFNDKLSVRSKASRMTGIKGARPTIVVPDWDTSTRFLQERDPRIPKFQSRFFSNKEEIEVVGRDGTELEKDVKVGAMITEENRALSESCSFSSNEDDSSSSMTEPMSSISSSERYGRVIHDWQKGELLGRGTFGSVYEGIADGGFFFAVKEVSLLDQGEDGKQCVVQLEQEIALLSQFEHENIVRYYGTEKKGSHLCIFLELVTQGSLLRLYQKYDLRVPQVSGYTRQILHGLKYLHDKGVIHRDIKCANILVHTNGLVKLADFGLAKVAKLNDVKSCKGTAFWMAPEVVRSKGYGLAADIWSLGCTVLEMLTRRFPYFGLEYMSALYKIGQGERPDVPATLSSDARDFILQCLQVDPSLRPTAAQLLDHPFVKRPLSSSAHSFGWQF
ncbi:mitogen-activated protein kinase kinase kinase 1-like [Salvia miltiorrhiza]|uniref:mitogen-activated protein kinase kinase kinase 1-like n=1 Tax=Salvia miltiorrhiza TaxID=226208 RepID=UPI0025ABBF68|nr:mitogen-activated protein kinase kinase kinase 1-like [Salvia miltiorrhiza]XP_057798487.1 mitogen-activated protein kinase kinase kinase 1-like [Salvia miltiorrhiza]